MKFDIFHIISIIPDYIDDYQRIEIVGWSLDTFLGLGRHTGIKISYTKQEIGNIIQNKINAVDIIKQSSNPVWFNPSYRSENNYYQDRDRIINQIRVKKYL